MRHIQSILRGIASIFRYFVEQSRRYSVEMQEAERPQYTVYPVSHVYSVLYYDDDEY